MSLLDLERARTWLADPRCTRGLVVALAIYAVAMGVRAARKPEGAIARSHQLGARFREVAAHGGNLYEPGGLHRPYPPSFALFFAPLSRLPLRVLRVLWFGLQLGLAALATWLLADLAAEWFSGWEHWRRLVLCLLLLLIARFLQRDLSGGQINLLVFTLCLLALWLVARDRRWLAGAPLGLAIAIKATPLLLVLYLVVRRQQRTALATLLAAGTLFTLPALFLGPSTFRDNAIYWLRGAWAQSTGDPLSAGLPVAYSHGNQSLRNAVHRYLRRSPSSRVSAGHADVAARAAAGSLLLLAAALILIRPAPDPATLPFFAECAIVQLLMLLLSPITWKAHLVHAALGLFLLLAYAICQGHRSSARWLLLFFVLCVAANRTTLGRHGEDLHQDYYVNTLGLLVLAVALGQLLLAARRTHAGLVGLPCES